MNELLQRWLQSSRAYFSGLTPKKRMALAMIASMVIVLGVGLSYWANQDPFQLLYSELQPEDAKAIAKKLSEANISYRISEDNATIMVAGSKVHVARMELAKAGLPGQDVVGFEKFDSTTLGMSSYVQRIQYIRAVQGELTRSIQRLTSVKRARVHISLPPKKTFLEEEDPPKASVILELHPGQIPSKQEISGIAHLVSSAVEGLKVNQVTIVDSKGNFLHRPEDEGQGAISTALLEMQRQIEQEYVHRVEDLLTPVVGMGKVRARITAEIDPSRTNTMEETYDPEKAVAKTTLKNEESSQGSRPNPIGIPGSRSNLPGTENQNPPIPMANTETQKNVQQNQYAIPKKIQTTDKPSGNIKRLTVAVVVDGYYNKGTNGIEAFSPRTEEELKRLQDVVANAVGYDPQRRDSITISSLPFKSVDLIGADEVAAEPVSWKENLKKEMMKHGIWGVLALLSIMFILKPLIRSATRSEAEKEVDLLPRTIAEIEAARKDEGLLALSKAAGLLEEGEPLDKQEELELKNRIIAKLDESPRKGFRIVQDWLEEEPAKVAA